MLDLLIWSFGLMGLYSVQRLQVETKSNICDLGCPTRFKLLFFITFMLHEVLNIWHVGWNPSTGGNNQRCN
jgi:hypothetical protein